jgi:hypothetical protein
MKFTDKFIELNSTCYDNKLLDNMNGDWSKVDLLSVPIKINIEEIEYYSSAIPGRLPFDYDNYVCTNIITKSGNEYLVDMKVSDFENYLNKFANENK